MKTICKHGIWFVLSLFLMSHCMCFPISNFSWMAFENWSYGGDVFPGFFENVIVSIQLQSIQLGCQQLNVSQSVLNTDSILLFGIFRVSRIN